MKMIAEKTLVAITGAMASAHAMRQINPDVVAAYPITPQTPIMMNFAQFVADGLADTEVVTVESEHSAMSACVGAAAAGARVMTATAANGLALMHEIVYIAASTRLPMVMSIVNRALSGPINIHCDHSDTMAERDSGWIQIFCENAQEVYESTILAMKWAENEKVLLPVMVNQDGFIISHSVENVEILPDDVVKEFVGEHVPHEPLLDVEHPITYGPLDLYDYYFEHKRQQMEAMKEAEKEFPKIAAKLSAITGNEYDFIESYKLDDAEYVIVTLGSSAGTVKYVVDEMRETGKKVGLLKIRVFRPFPGKRIAEALNGKKAVAVLDRSASFGAEAPIYAEVKSALYTIKERPILQSYVYGLGGRDFTPDHAKTAFDRLMKGEFFEGEGYLGLRD
ncbi:MAG: pyruvate ferredoxin oxidoreductase [Thermotoga sp.]|nr:pyruvate ferredoxin oxidoreductase [Thermotogota bacterium]RKX55591.1 MAG: pyruvate ferredoxin oxidoreductase [Thermotoga sp.]